MAEKINEAEFRKLVRRIIKENVKDLGDALEQDLNQHDDVATSEHENELLGAPENTNDPSQSPMDTKEDNEKHAPKTPKPEQLKEAKDVENAGDAIDVKMNSQESDHGHDEEIAAAVEVEAANGTHSGEFTKGMSKSNFDSKSGMNDSTNENGGDDKGVDATEAEMNQMDKEIDEGTKTFVEAGAEMKNAGASTGQADAKFSEEAKNEKADEPIATAIQLPENFSEKSWTKSDLMSLIKEEATRVSKLLK
jgi:hypothetical protein